MKIANNIKRFFRCIMILSSCVLTVILILSMLTFFQSTTSLSPVNTEIRKTYDQHLNNQLSNVLDGIVSIQRVYELSDSDITAPKPNPDCYGQTDDPAKMQEILDQAATLLNGQQTLFSTDMTIREGSQIHYYLDESIFAVTWKQVFDDAVYTFSEVKIAHPSQFRRFLSDGRYNSYTLHTTTEMSETVNAVVASSGDFYDYRSIGIVVNNGIVYRDRGHYLDTCYIDENGDLLFTYAGDILDMDTAQEYVDRNHVRFSLSFGPVILENGEFRVPADYNSGEINDRYARAALCQLDQLHYLVVASNIEAPYHTMPTVAKFGRCLEKLGIHTAYTIDGGQTAAIVMNNQLINTVSYGAQRKISDIFYFATALPSAETNEVNG